MRSHNLRGGIQIAVIGGNGFLGRAIIHRLSGYPNLRIFSIDKRTHGVHIDTSKSKAIIEQIQMDIGNEGAIRGWLMTHPVDVVIFLAGFENPTDGLSVTFVQDTKALYGLTQAIMAIQDMHLEDYEERPYFMYVSSWSVYGPSKGIQKEDSKEFPANYTGMSRLMAEDLVKRVCTKAKAPYCILRPSEIYGKRNNKELRDRRYWPGYLNYYLDKIVRREEVINIFSPDTKIDLVNINHFTKVVRNFIENKVEGIYNISSGNTIKIKELVETLIGYYENNDNCPSKLEYRKDLKIEHMNLCNKKVEDLVPYDHDKYILEDFIKDYIKVRRYEIAKDMAIEDALSEPILIDMASLQAKESFEARKVRRKLAYGKIKEIAGEEFFKIKVGRIKERYEKLIDLEVTPELLEKAKKEQNSNNNRLKMLRGDLNTNAGNEAIKEIDKKQKKLETKKKRKPRKKIDNK